MTLASPKGNGKMVAFPRGLTSIAASVVILAMFLIFASWLLVSFPIGSAIRGYFYGVDGKIVLPASKNVDYSYSNSSSGSNLELPTMSSNSSVVVNNEKAEVSIRSVEKDSMASESNVEPSSSGKDSVDLKNNATLEKPTELPKLSSRATEKKADMSGFLSSNTSESNSVDSGCDLYNGKWFYDPQGPSYTNNSCPVITQMQNCQGNGRPDEEYENWRWKPSKCDLPRFDAKKFLELMRGKTLAFIGDSVARNQMESDGIDAVSSLAVPQNRGNKRMQRWHFVSTSVMIVRLWSSWLVRETTEKIDFAPEGVTKLHLDAPDDKLMEFIPKFDVIVISSGHWFAKQSVYVLNNEIVGGQLWWPNGSPPMKVNNVDAFGISVGTILSAILTHPNYTGLTIVRSFSPDHYEGGAWNTGGSCTGKEKPLAIGELVENGFTNIMHEKQVSGFEHAVKKATNKSKLRLMDITEVFSYRHDGHPGPYRNPDPNKITKRGPDGKPPPQDCLHWCMPGPIDTWNELVLEIIRREFEGNRNLSS